MAIISTRDSNTIQCWHTRREIWQLHTFKFNTTKSKGAQANANATIKQLHFLQRSKVTLRQTQARYSNL